LQSEITRASLEVEVEDPLALHKAELDFSIQRALEADLVLRPACKCWSEVDLISIEAELGQQMAFYVPSGTCFGDMARGDLAMEIFLYLRVLAGFEPHSERSRSNFS